MKSIQKKICMIGSFAVGKTSLVRRFVDEQFDDRYISTIGVKLSQRKVVCDDYAVNLLLWDLAGGEDFMRSNETNLRGAAGGLLVCDLTRPQTIHSINKYADQIRRINPKVKLILIGNKADLEDELYISEDDLEAVSQSIPNCVFFRTSAKTGANVDNVFHTMANSLLPNTPQIT